MTSELHLEGEERNRNLIFRGRKANKNVYKTTEQL